MLGFCCCCHCCWVWGFCCGFLVVVVLCCIFFFFFNSHLFWTNDIFFTCANTGLLPGIKVVFYCIPVYLPAKILHVFILQTSLWTSWASSHTLDLMPVMKAESSESKSVKDHKTVQRIAGKCEVGVSSASLTCTVKDLTALFILHFLSHQSAFQFSL